jgi:hypothetical protein
VLVNGFIYGALAGVITTLMASMAGLDEGLLSLTLSNLLYIWRIPIVTRNVSDE